MPLDSRYAADIAFALRALPYDGRLLDPERLVRTAALADICLGNPPEPAAGAIFLAGLGVLGWLRRRLRQARLFWMS
ncbi:MAG TPA: PEP-CTERM sorting domain-containing protein [Candidatus Sulfopaludibacter sp.]|nr:PEP-CTERM sorting domain-containing protein [Candidatus Sulfopaludibacter sp.]